MVAAFRGTSRASGVSNLRCASYRHSCGFVHCDRFGLPVKKDEAETSDMLHALIMAGGSGTRFWPASRDRAPKQLLRLVGDRTMLQATLDRLQGLVTPKTR